MYSGSILGLALSPHLIAMWGWASVFGIFGSLGVLWFAAWLRSAASSPVDDPKLTAAEEKYIVANTCPQVRLCLTYW